MKTVSLLAALGAALFIAIPAMAATAVGLPLDAAADAFHHAFTVVAHALSTPDGMAVASLLGVAPMSDAERRKGRFMRDGSGHASFAGKTPEEIAGSLRDQIKTQTEEVGNKAAEALAEAKRTGALADETKNRVDEALTGIGAVREQLAAMEQKMARKPEGGEPVPSFGEQIIKSDRYAAFKQAGSFEGGMRFGLKAITAAQAGTAFSDRTGRVSDLPQRELTMRDLLTVIPTTSGSVDYAQQTTRTNNAAPVAEAAQKPTSAYVWAQVTAAVRVIAHLTKITRQAMDDAVQLQGKVDAEMRYGLAIVEEAQILNGDGTGQNLTGLVPAATAFTAPITIAGATPIDNLRLAMLQAELALYPSDGIVLNPADWAHIELTKSTTGEYIFANPTNLAGPRLWSRPVVSTVAMTIDKFLVGFFKGQTLYDRMAPEVVIASENADDFEKNLLTMRCEERVALAVEKPGALIYGDFGFV